MKLIVCVDDNLGISFFGKRQSMDEIQRKDVFETVKNNKVYLSQYSYDLYKDLNLDFKIVSGDEENNFDGYFIYEGEFLESFIDYIDEIICYNWNRNYPFDETFDELKKDIWKEIERLEFVGKSHEKITKIRYVRV
ncbi:MAG: hypothetical protein PT934_03425 [Peptoniphilaceae bacterium]|uniref:hypothetical protein n=1 Tax=Parvimonas sp. TaxID=1944660 RepID=UPI0025DD6A1F|nr:hypothetical protein [Parvimonas sp.]MCI5996815.1 hypothetical protein [Parvimonas sp.]MDD7764800.1 hypothetical protein [Peptoniphilaceae bacterium]MDY3050868.1 hypothetical protein [Parvimonas sp.]